MFASFAHEPPVRRRLLQLLTWTWCLPTTLVGLAAGAIALVALGGRREEHLGATVIRSRVLRSLGGVCLGPVILVPDDADAAFVRHEWGHFRQHLRLGPLYLPLVGIPSLTHAVWHRLRGGGHPAYFHFWTEAWADALGGVYALHAHRHARWTGYAFGPALVLLVAGLTLRAFGHALGFPFTDADALADVAWARFPLSEQLLVPLTGGVGGDNANFWRPAAMVQFWALRHVFGEAPAGWHAWDLLLHAVASGLVGALVLAVTRALGRPDRPLALLSAAFFVAHPLAEEVVPATARDLDLLFGVGFFGALLALVAFSGARGAGRRGLGAAAGFWLASAVALGAKDAGVLLLPIAAAWLLLLARPQADRRAFVRSAGLLLGPLAVLLVGYLVMRAHVLGGLGGYHDPDALAEGSHLGSTLGRAFLEPLASAFSPALAPLRDAPGVALTWGVWAALLYGLRRSARLLVLAAVIYVPWILLLGLTGTYSRRVLYAPTFAIALVLALAALTAIRALREARGSGLTATVGAGLGAAGAAGLLAAWAYGSPAIGRYSDWDAAGRVATPLLDPAVWARFPDGATVWLVDRPARVDLDPRRYRLWSKRKSLANAATTYAIEAWVDEHVPRGLTVKTLSAIVPEGEPEAFPGTVAADRDMVRVIRPAVARTLGEVPGVRVDEDAAGVVVTWDGATAPTWLLVWDQESPVVGELSSGGAQVWSGR